MKTVLIVGSFSVFTAYQTGFIMTCVFMFIFLSYLVDFFTFVSRLLIHNEL